MLLFQPEKPICSESETQFGLLTDRFTDILFPPLGSFPIQKLRYLKEKLDEVFQTYPQLQSDVDGKVTETQKITEKWESIPSNDLDGIVSNQKKSIGCTFNTITNRLSTCKNAKMTVTTAPNPSPIHNGSNEFDVNHSMSTTSQVFDSAKSHNTTISSDTLSPTLPTSAFWNEADASKESVLLSSVFRSLNMLPFISPALVPCCTQTVNQADDHQTPHSLVTSTNPTEIPVDTRISPLPVSQQTTVKNSVVPQVTSSSHMTGASLTTSNTLITTRQHKKSGDLVSMPLESAFFPFGESFANSAALTEEIQQALSASGLLLDHRFDSREFQLNAAIESFPPFGLSQLKDKCDMPRVSANLCSPTNSLHKIGDNQNPTANGNLTRADLNGLHNEDPFVDHKNQTNCLSFNPSNPLDVTFGTSPLLHLASGSSVTGVDSGLDDLSTTRKQPNGIQSKSANLNDLKSKTTVNKTNEVSSCEFCFL